MYVALPYQYRWNILLILLLFLDGAVPHDAVNVIVPLILPSPEQEVSLYEASHDLQYLDMVVQETLRMYPPLPRYVVLAYISRIHFLYAFKFLIGFRLIQGRKVCHMHVYT